MKEIIEYIMSKYYDLKDSINNDKEELNYAKFSKKKNDE